MRIRIMHVVNNLGKGGLENGLVNLIQHLDAGAFEHVVCTIRGLGPNKDRLPLDRVQVISLAESGRTSRVQTPALIRTIRRYKPDIVHSRNWAAVEAVIAARLAGRCAVVHSEHGYEADAAAKEPWRRIAVRRVSFELADRVLAVSRQLRDLHAERTGFAAGKITVVHNGVDHTRFFPDPPTRVRIRKELGIGDGLIAIGCVANLLPVKAHRTLLEALALMSTDGSEDWRLLLIGEGPERPALEDFAAVHAGLKERISFLGPSNRVSEMLQALDVFVLPSMAEGICNALLEAMASGLPVIASAVGGNPEVVVEKQSGLLFPAGDAPALATVLRELLAQPMLRLQLGQQGLRRIRDEFSLQSMVQTYDKLYRSVRAAGVPVLSAG